jgi:hypothetical protein
VLGIVADDRLEAIGVWKIVTGTDGSRGDQDANFWQDGWKRVLYVTDLTSAPSNVGWTEQPGVRGAGTALIRALKDKARACQCDGIGLSGFAYNVDFYLHAGFRQKGGTGSLTFLMDVGT